MTDKISRYLDDEMGKEEKVAFEKELSLNNELKSKLDLQRKLDDFVLEVDELDELNARIKRIGEKVKLEKIKKKRFNLVSISVAATVLVLIGIFTVNVISSKPSYIYKKNFKVWDTGALVSRSNSNAVLNEWDILYNEGNYSALINMYNHMREAGETNEIIDIMYSCALMHEEKFGEALKSFESIDCSKSMILSNDVMWYVALCYLQLNNEQKALSGFQALAETNNKYTQKAQIIVDKLNP